MSKSVKDAATRVAVQAAKQVFASSGMVPNAIHNRIRQEALQDMAAQQPAIGWHGELRRLRSNTGRRVYTTPYPKGPWFKRTALTA
jgi:hypothetical protein